MPPAPTARPLPDPHALDPAEPCWIGVYGVDLLLQMPSLESSSFENPDATVTTLQALAFKPSLLLDVDPSLDPVLGMAFGDDELDDEDEDLDDEDDEDEDEDDDWDDEEEDDWDDDEEDDDDLDDEYDDEDEDEDLGDE